jgi:hypothetical protein
MVPNVTNVHASNISHTAIQVDAQHNTSNTTENDGNEPSGGSEIDASSADYEEDHADADSMAESTGPNPEVDHAGPPPCHPSRRLPHHPCHRPPPARWTPRTRLALRPLCGCRCTLCPLMLPLHHLLVKKNKENVVHTPSLPPPPSPPPPLVVPRTRLQHGIKNQKHILMELFDMACLLQQVNQVHLLKLSMMFVGVRL